MANILTIGTSILKYDLRYLSNRFGTLPLGRIAGIPDAVQRGTFPDTTPPWPSGPGGAHLVGTDKYWLCPTSNLSLTLKGHPCGIPVRTESVLRGERR